MGGGAFEIPPLVERDAVAVGVGSGADGGVAGSGHGVGVVVVAVGEVCAALEEEIEAVGGLEVVAVAYGEIAAELVEDEDDDQLGLGVVGVCVGLWGGRQQEEQTEKKQRRIYASR